MRKQVILTAMCLGALLAQPVVAQTADVPPGHWAYAAVQELAADGLVLGYPDGNFLGQRTLTRYEMATLVQRVIARIEGRMDALPRNPDGAASPAVPATLTAEQETQVRRLLEEYKTELAVIGADLQAVKARLDAQDERLKTLDRAVTDPKGPVQSTAAAVSALRKTRIGGYIQFRYQSRSDSRDDVRPGGALANEDTFSLRRNRINVRHTLKEGNQFVFEVDASQGNSAQIRNAYLTLPLARAQGKEAVPTLWAGQFKYPFGFEIQQSSSEREFPERSRGERALFPGERDRGIKVEGTLGSRALLWQAALVNGNGIGDPNGGGILPGTGVRGAGGVMIPARPYNWRDTNSARDFVGRLLFEPGRGHLALGASAYAGKTTAATGAFDANSLELYGRYDKTRYGAEVRYSGLPHTLIGGEYVIGQEFNPARRNAGGLVEDSADVQYWYAQIVRSLNARNAIGVRYDYYDPDTDEPTVTQAANTGSFIGVGTLTVAARRFLTDATRLTLAYEKPYLPRDEDGSRSKQDLFTVQLQYRY